MQVSNFFKDLTNLEEIIQSANTPDDLSPLTRVLKILVVDDMEIIRSMEKEVRLKYI